MIKFGIILSDLGSGVIIRPIILLIMGPYYYNIKIQCRTISIVRF